MTWAERRRAWHLRQIRDDRLEAAASAALNNHQAARAVFQLYEQTSRGRFDLERIESVELDALGSLIEAELQDRSRRESATFETWPELNQPEPRGE